MYGSQVTDALFFLQLLATGSTDKTVSNFTMFYYVILSIMLVS
jgi:hypothetical protein